MLDSSQSFFYCAGSWKHGVWTLRVKSWFIQLKAPHNKPLFSERNGYRKILFSRKGWRILTR